MKTRKYQASDEKVILSAMIMNDEVLDKIARNLKGITRPFRSKWSNVVAGWCLEYWRSYKKAPKKLIQNRFAKFAQSTQDDDSIDLIETFLSALSDEYVASKEQINVQFVIDTASRFFNEVRFEELGKQISTAVENKDMESAVEVLKGFEPVAFAAGQNPDPNDANQIRTWLDNESNEVLVRFPHAIGDFFGDTFGRDSFISFAGPEKRGKSYWLLEVVWQALRSRRRVLYYVTGDMSEKQAMVRFLRRATRLPSASKEVALPTRLVKKDDHVKVRRRRVEKRALSLRSSVDAIRKLNKRTGAKRLRLETRIYESSTLSASDIESEIAELSKKGWPPDVVVIDYADILVAEPHARHMEYRHQVNETWKTLRRISQRFHLCLVTATQTAATSYDSRIIKKSDFSEDKRKAAHVTGMLGINQTPDEKKEGIYRLNWIFLRDGHWTETQVVHTAGELTIANPCIISSIF